MRESFLRASGAKRRQIRLTRFDGASAVFHPEDEGGVTSRVEETRLPSNWMNYLSTETG